MNGERANWIEHPVVRFFVAILIGWSWIRLLRFVAILFWLIVDGTTLARAIGGVLLLLVVVWMWRSFRPN